MDGIGRKRSGLLGRQGESVRRLLAWTALVAALGCFGLLLFKHLSYPLIWNDEGETVMYGVRVLEYGYPKVHGSKNIVYESSLPIEVTVREDLDAYVGTTWGHFYFASLGVWLAAGIDDPFQRTALLRLPFAIAGLSGLVLLLVALAPALPPRWRVPFAAAFFGLSCFSVSLILHLREARYYSLLVLLSSAIWLVYQRRYVQESLSRRAYSVWLPILLVLTFNTFYPAYFALAAGLGLDRGLTWLRAPGSLGSRVRGLAADLVPFLVSFVVVLPLLWFFDTLAIAAEFSRQLCALSEGAGPLRHLLEFEPSFCFGLPLYLSNVREVTSFLLQHELLGPLLVVQLGLGGLIRFAGLRESQSAEPLRAVVRAFWTSLVVYVLVLSRNPAIFERYFTLLGPWVTATFLVACLRLFLARPPVQGRDGLRAFVCVLVVGALLFSAGSRWHLVTERWYEIWHRYRGPLDVAVPFLQETYGDTEDLVIAANYESTPLMYYLGSRVIVQWNAMNLEAEKELQPDVVIARQGYGRSAIEHFEIDDRYETTEFDVRDSFYNNIPELYPMGNMRAFRLPLHRFREKKSRWRSRNLRVHWIPPERAR